MTAIVRTPNGARIRGNQARHLPALGRIAGLVQLGYTEDEIADIEQLTAAATRYRIRRARVLGLLPKETP